MQVVTLQLSQRHYVYHQSGMIWLSFRLSSTEIQSCITFHIGKVCNIQKVVFSSNHTVLGANC